MVEPWIFGPHAGKFLADQTNGVLHRASSVGVTAGRDSSITPAEAKDLKDRDRVGHRQKERVDIDRVAKRDPYGPR